MQKKMLIYRHCPKVTMINFWTTLHIKITQFNIFFINFGDHILWNYSFFDKYLILACWHYHWNNRVKLHAILSSKKVFRYHIFYQARAERGLFTNYEDTVPGPSDSIGAPKMYISEKGFLENCKNYQVQLFYVLSFPLGYL